MKSLVITINIKPEGAELKRSPSTFSWTPDIFYWCTNSTREWATRMNADFLEIKDDSYFPGWHPTWQRMALFLDKFNQYDQILYADGDYGVHELTPDILKWTSKQPEEFFARLDDTSNRHETNPNYFNAGFFIIKRPLINRLKGLVETAMEQFKNASFKDQDALNWILNKSETKIGTLSMHWNGLFSRYHPLFSVHYLGPGKVRFTEKDFRKKMLHKMELCYGKTSEELQQLFREDTKIHIKHTTLF